MISGLWQLAGGHDQNVDFAVAAKAIDSLYASLAIPAFEDLAHVLLQDSFGL
jgi:hypothetical protein